MIEQPDPSSAPGAFRFRGGHRALDLTATLGGRARGAMVERIPTRAELADWLSRAFAIPAPPTDRTDVQTAHRIREAIFTLAIEAQDNAEHARDILNAAAAGRAAVPVLGPPLGWSGDASALLAQIAREAVLLFAGADAARVRRCEGEGCSILFLDNSRRGDRRWCSMAGCGNKAKVAEFRRRHRKGDG